MKGHDFLGVGTGFIGCILLGHLFAAYPMLRVGVLGFLVIAIAFAIFLALFFLAKRSGSSSYYSYNRGQNIVSMFPALLFLLFVAAGFLIGAIVVGG
jgi:hypothetical protein